MDQTINNERDVLDRFHPAVASWFREQFGEPTPAAAAGLAGDRVRAERLDRRPDRLGQDARRVPGGPRPPLADASEQSKGVRILYISPLKALNQDVWRNLQFPLEGILAAAEAMDTPLPPLEVAVRSGDTPARSGPGWSGSPRTS